MSDHVPSSTRSPRTRNGWPPLLAAALSLAALGWAAMVHHGLGPAPAQVDAAWWEPIGFMRGWPFMDALFDAPFAGVLLLTAPTAAILAVLHLRPAPALARAGASAATTTTAILAFYGLLSTATGVWSFFHWRGSAVMVSSGVLLGCALAAPDLARAMGRVRPILAVVLYGGVLFCVSALIRNATGWDAQLAFNISPWPAIPVLALEIAALAWVGMLAGMAIATASTAAAATPTRRAAGIALGVATPVLWFALAFPHTRLGLLLAGLGLSAIGVGAAIVTARGEHPALAERAAALAAAAALVLLPIVAGRAMADGDFTVSKHVRARAVIDALATYYAEEGIYPEELDDLVEVGHLEAIPAPRIGSGLWASLDLAGVHAFDYRNLGSSYVLEFVATEWIMCSYNPPWEEEVWAADEQEEATSVDGAPDAQIDSNAVYDDCLRVCHASCNPERRDCSAFCGGACDAERAEHAAIAKAEAEDSGGEAWSCPDSRPELW